MLNRIITFYDKFHIWVVGGLLALLVVGGLYCYVLEVKNDKLKSDLNSATLKLSVSNASVDSLKVQLQRISETLKENERIEKEKQDYLAKKLKLIDEQDKAKIDLESKLKTRPSTLNCSIPKDLENAWNAL